MIRKNARLLGMYLLSAGLIQGTLGTLAVAAKIDIVVGPQASDLERLAATELAGQFARLFDAKTSISTVVPDGTKYIVLLGNPRTNPAIKTRAANDWPKLSDQGILLRSFADKNQQGVIVAGGSPVATLWAAYELGHRFGIRYLLRRDVYPATPIPLKLKGFNSVMEPSLKTRTWRTINDFAIGPESWGLADQQKLLKQLAKLKFNRVMLSVYPWQPFVDYEFGGVKKQTVELWYGEQYKVDGDTPGKKVFRGAKLFQNPNFVGQTTYAQKTAAGTKLLSGIIDTAATLGISTGISISPLEFPKEFAKLLPGAKATRGLNQLLVAPGAKQLPNDPTLQKLVATKIRAYLKTYPKLDSLYLTLPEFPEWDEHAALAWKQLDARKSLGKHSLQAMIESAEKRGLIASGSRGVKSVKGNLVALAFLNALFDDASILKRPDGKSVELVISSADPALYPVLDRVLPNGAAALHFVDYTARRIVENIDTLKSVPADKVRSRLILTLADDNVGVLPQSTTGRLESLVRTIRKQGWDGFSTRYWILGELDPSVYFLSRAAFDEKVTAQSALDDLFVTITGNQAAADRLLKCFDHIEAATELIDKHNLGFAFPVKNMVMKHYVAEEPPAWWAEANEHYLQSMIELYRSHGACRSEGRRLLFHYAKRGEYALTYLATVKALREAAIAKKKGDTEAAIEKLEVAVESMHDSINTLSDVAEDQSDRGLIAVLANYGYRPLVAELEKMLDAADSE